MAIVKHIKSRNANYSDAINYLLFEHDEKTGKKIVDESGRSILRKEFYMDGLNCDPMSFDKECELTNMHFHKNRERSDIKSHHYIISFDPADVTENGLTGERAQAISIELAKQMFPGYQALVVTHTDGHNESGNIHTHIVINSVRKYAVDRQPYMDKPHEERAGYKHRSTDKFIKFFKKAVMDRCQQEGLHQIDLLAPAERKITQAEYMAQKSGQEKLEKVNQEIVADELNVKNIKFTDDVRDFTSYSFKPQLKTVGPKYGKMLGGIKAALNDIDGNAAMDELNTTGVLKLDVNGQEIELFKEDLLIDTAQIEGYESVNDNGITVVLDTNLTPELLEEGFVREIISKIQTMRKEADFEVMDKIRVTYEGSEKAEAVFEKNSTLIGGEVLATEVVKAEPAGHVKEWKINGEAVTMGVEKKGE